MLLVSSPTTFSPLAGVIVNTVLAGKANVGPRRHSGQISRFNGLITTLKYCKTKKYLVIFDTLLHFRSP